jgi:hypothetical protein
MSGFLQHERDEKFFVSFFLLTNKGREIGKFTFEDA